MRVVKATWVRIPAAILAAIAVATAAQAATPKPKRAGGRRADLLAIPEVPKDQVICFALYTVHAGVLKLNAQLYPLDQGDPQTVRLELKQDGQWKDIIHRSPPGSDNISNVCHQLFLWDMSGNALIRSFNLRSWVPFSTASIIEPASAVSP